jgi:hypothetical protein
LTPAPTRPKTPSPKVSGELSSRRNEKPVANPEATPLSLRAVPNRFVGGNRPPIAPAGSELCRWMLGKTRAEPSRNSWFSRPLKIAGFQ